MSTTTQNRLRSTYAGITLSGEPHPLSAWFVLVLRVLMGGMILFAGLGKYEAVPGGDAFNAYGYLANSEGIGAGMFTWMAETAVVLDTINVIIPATQVLIGIALIFGGFVRLAALGGALQMTMFYMAGFDGEWLAIFDNTLIYAVVFLALGAFAAGRIVGVDRYIESYRIGEQRLVERYPKLKYLLG